MKIIELLKKTKLSKLDAELLLAHVINKSREFVISHHNDHLTNLQKFKYSRLEKKRVNGVPLAYLTGHKEFFGLDFLANKHTLVPRPDTEILVEEVVQDIKNKESIVNGQLLMVDVGTGSGCIPISIAKTIEQYNNVTMPTIYATDISKPALQISKKNSNKHNVDITFLHGNLLEPIIKKFEILNLKSEIFITANLPYLTEEQFANEPSIQKEPKTALVAESDGLALYEELLKQMQSLSTNYKLQTINYFEIDPSQTEKIKGIIKKYFPETKIEIKKDLSGLDRLVKFEM